MRSVELGGQAQRDGVRGGPQHQRDGVLRTGRSVAAHRRRQVGVGGMPEEPVDQLRVARVRAHRRQRHRVADGRLFVLHARRPQQNHR